MEGDENEGSQLEEGGRVIEGEDGERKKERESPKRSE